MLWNILSIVREDIQNIKRKFIIKVNKFSLFLLLYSNDRFLKLMRPLIWRIISGKNSVLCQFVALWTHRKRTINSFLSYVVKYTHILFFFFLSSTLYLKILIAQKILLHCLEFFIQTRSFLESEINFVFFSFIIRTFYLTPTYRDEIISSPKWRNLILFVTVKLTTSCVIEFNEDWHVYILLSYFCDLHRSFFSHKFIN